jgi:hypothetical protein
MADQGDSEYRKGIGLIKAAGAHSYAGQEGRQSVDLITFFLLRRLRVFGGAQYRIADIGDAAFQFDKNAVIVDADGTIDFQACVQP